MGVIFIQANDYLLVSKIRNKERLISIALSFYTIGALISPILSSLVVSKNFKWELSYYLLILIIIFIIILYLFIIKEHRYNSVIKSGEKTDFKVVFTSRNRRIILSILTIISITYSISETVISTWSPTFLRLEKMFNTQNAGLAMTVFWSGVLIGRIIGIMFLGKVRSSYLMLVFSILSLVALIFIFNTISPFSVLISYAIGGLGFSVLFPLLVSKGGTVFSNGSRTIITILYVSSTIGFSITPFLTRFVSQNNLVLSVWLSFIFMFIVFLFLIAYIILEKSLFRKGT